MTTAEVQSEALDRAKHGQSLTNYPAIVRGFMAKGIAESDIRPRENVFTYQAWLKLGRQVRKGERGVRILTYIRGEKTETDEQVRLAATHRLLQVENSLRGSAGETGDALADEVLHTLSDVRLLEERCAVTFCGNQLIELFNLVAEGNG